MRAPSRFNLRPHIPVAAALLITAAAYFFTLTSGFQRDDWAHLAYVSDLHNSPFAFCMQVYRPLYLAEFQAMFRLFGINAIFWHIVELGIHLLNVWLIYRLALRFKFSAWASACGALAFGVYPPSMDAVGWLCAVSGVMVACMSLIAALVSLETRIPALFRGLLCVALWTCALFCKEEAACMVAVLPFLPVVAKIKQTRVQWFQWGLSCLTMLVGLFALAYCEQQCNHHFSNLGALLNARILKMSIAFVAQMTSVTNMTIAASAFSTMLLIPIALGFWLRYPTTRPGLFWLCAGGFALGMTYGSAVGPCDRYEYIPSIGMGLCLCAVVDRMRQTERPLQFHSFLLIPLMACSIAQGYFPEFIIAPACLVLFLMRSDNKGQNKASHDPIIVLLILGLIYRAAEYVSPWLGIVWPIDLPMQALLSIFIAASAALWIRFGKKDNPPWPEMALCSLIAFTTSATGIVVLIVGILLIEIAIKRFPKASGILQEHKWVLRFGATIAAGIVIAAWSYQTYTLSVEWQNKGSNTQRSVLAAASVLKRLPRGAKVEILDAAELASPEPAIFDVLKNQFAKRPDLRVSWQCMANMQSDKIAIPERKAYYRVLVTPDNKAALILPL